MNPDRGQTDPARTTPIRWGTTEWHTSAPAAGPPASGQYPGEYPAGQHLPGPGQWVPGPGTGTPSSTTDEDFTEPIPVVSGDAGADRGEPGDDGKSLAKASGSMAIATLISRITGFLWKIVLAGIIGLGAANDSFTAANNLPNSVFELLIGGVLTSVIVPVLVRAQKTDTDGGQAYMQRLVTMSVVVLGIGTVLSVVGAPLLTMLFVSTGERANPELATTFAYLLLPQIFFYGLGALFTSILQARRIFAPTAWAPVMNNVVILVTLTIYTFVPGEISLDPVRMTDAHVLVLGIGVTCGVVSQAAIQIPSLLRSGFRFRWRWGWDPRLNEFGGLALWMIAYVAVSLVGLSALSRVGTAYGSYAIYTNAWLLLQLPYGVIGFSVMTAILPRMSSAAADGDTPRMLDDLSLGNRLSTVMLLPISAIMTVLGVQLGVALFSLGKSGADAAQLGLALAVSAFGVLPYAITMMQMRAFYALKDARAPTLIMVIMTVVKVALAYLCPIVLSSDNVVLGLTFVNSLTFVIGWLAGEIWLRHRLGPLGSRRMLVTLGKTLLGSAAGAAVAWGVSLAIGALMPVSGGAGTAWVQLIVGTLVGLAAIFAAMWTLKVSELQPAITRIVGLVRRR